MKAKTWLMGGAALVFCAVLALVFASPLRQGMRNIVNVLRVQWNTVEIDRSLAQKLSTNSLVSSLEQTGPSEAAAVSGPLRVSTLNPRYFADANGNIVYLTGSHTWSNFQDNGNPPPAFDFNQYLDFLVANNHNFTRLWRWEQSRWTLETTDGNYWFFPEGPWLRSGPGAALDGKLKWDLNQFDQSYFDRLRARVAAAGERNIYVAVMLFDGWSVSANKGGFSQNNPWRGHPMHKDNNINGVNGDANNDNSGEESHQLGNAPLLAYQQAYVRKVVDSLNDLDNVLWEISNESHGDATAWQNAMVDYIKQYEATKPKQHPVGMTAEWPNGNDAELFASNADWISPSNGVYMTNPPDAAGQAVIILDSDHLWGIGGDRQWVWKSFTRGLNPIFMDGYDGASYGVGGAGFNFNDPTWVKLRSNMGYTLGYARRMNLAAMTPRSDLCSTTFCLANPVAPGAEFLIYQPTANAAFTVNLAGLSGSFNVEWLNPDSGVITAGNSVNGGGSTSFTPPFSGDAVLYLKQAAAPAPTPTATATMPAAATATPMATATATGTATLVPTATGTATPKATATGTATAVPIVTATSTSTPKATATLIATATATAVPVVTGTATATPKATATATATATRSVAPTVTATASATLTATPAAAFPGSPLLDNFNRPNGGLGVNWMQQPSSYGVANLRLRMLTTGRSFWKPNTFGSNQEAFVRLATVDRAAKEVGLLLKATFNNGSIIEGIAVGYSPATKRVRAGVITQGVYHALAPEMQAVFASGDRLGARARSDGMVELYRNSTLLGSVNAGPALAAAGGPIGVYVDYGSSSGSTLLDDFGGGNASSVTGTGYQLRVGATAAGMGAVGVEPAGEITCGQLVTITAAPAGGWQFVGWSGDVVDNRNPLVYNLIGSLTLTANFAPESAIRAYNISVQTVGDGVVELQPAGPYALGQVVAVQAQANSGWLFIGWEGARQSDDNPLYLQIEGDALLTATFAPASNLYLPAVQQGSDGFDDSQAGCD